MRAKLLQIVAMFLGLILIANAAAAEKHLLYVAAPGIRNYTDWGEGILVFDIDDGHKLLRRIPTAGPNPPPQPEAVKGICASSATGLLYISRPSKLACFDLNSDKLVWERKYDSGCDRMSITPDGKQMYMPSGDWNKTPYWYVIDGPSGNVITKIDVKDGTHNTVCSLDGRRAFLASLHFPYLSVVDTESNKIIGQVGPFSAPLRPFTVNGSATLCLVTVNELLGFEVGDVRTGKVLCRIEVEGFKKGPTKRHGCPSHGVGFTPDEKQIWVTDAANSALHVYDATAMPPKHLADVTLNDQPGWITFSIDGRYAYPSTGDVVDVQSRKIIATLKDERGKQVQSEKLLEIDFDGNKVSRCGDQFGLGRKLGI